MAAKQPKNDTQFAAVVAYYYQFEATERKDAISKEDLLAACRLVGRDRPPAPEQTLRNAMNAGLLDSADRGTFAINSVGENLVAVTLPGDGTVGSSAGARRKRPARNTSAKKSIAQGASRDRVEKGPGKEEVTTAHDAIEATVGDLERLRRLVSKGTSQQIKTATDLDVIKANVHTWLRTRRPIIVASLDEKSLYAIDAVFSELLAATHRAAVRNRYKVLIKNAKRILSTLQAENAVELSSTQIQAALGDAAPSFAAIAGDARMQKILQNRWNECVSCVGYNLPLAATVMMGGLLEAVLLARINMLPDKKPVFTATAAPKDKKSGATLPLKEWGLNSYIDVAHELKWISDTYKDVGVILRDYRNYIHPHKGHQHGKALTGDDAKVLWEIGKTILHQVLKA